jgi:hypothetical protein
MLAASLANDGLDVVVFLVGDVGSDEKGCSRAG